MDSPSSPVDPVDQSSPAGPVDPAHSADPVDPSSPVDPAGRVGSGSAGVFRLYSTHNRVFNGLGMFGGAVVAAALAVLAHGWLVRTGAAALCLGLLAWGVRGSLVGVVGTADRLVIRELTRTYSVPWDEVLGITLRTDPRFKITAPAFIVHTERASPGRRGGRLSAMSLANKRRKVVEGYVQTLTTVWRAHMADSPR